MLDYVLFSGGCRWLLRTASTCKACASALVGLSPPECFDHDILLRIQEHGGSWRDRRRMRTAAPCMSTYCRNGTLAPRRSIWCRRAILEIRKIAVELWFWRNFRHNTEGIAVPLKERVTLTGPHDPRLFNSNWSRESLQDLSHRASSASTHAIIKAFVRKR